MRYLTVEDFFAPSANSLVGMSSEQEYQRLLDSIGFIKLLNDELKFDNRILCTSINIYVLFTRKHAFTEFHMYLACAMAHMIAAKVEYKHPRIDYYERFVHERAPQPKLAKGKLTARKSFDEASYSLR